MRAALLALPLLAALSPFPVLAQALDLTQGGPIEVTASNGIEWRQQEQVVIARGNARAVRAGVTVTADRLIARYRPRAGQAAPPPGSEDTPMSGGEIWRLEAEGNVRIDSATDHAEGDRAIYDMDQAVLVMTGRALKLTTPQEVLTSRDSMEYWPARRMAVARGAAHVVTQDQRQIFADTLVGYFQEQGQGGSTPAQRRPAQAANAPANAPASAPAGQAAPAQGSQLERVEAFGNVEIRTPAEVVRGDRGVYSELTGMARLLGNVRITRGDNQLNGQEAIVNMRSGVARLVSTPGARVQGLIIPQQGQEAAQPAPNNAPQGTQQNNRSTPR